jgi:hypothetical protein
MRYFDDYFLKLSPYLEFDPNAFIGNEDIPQQLCNFVLALSLAYNDYKYYNLSYDMLLKSGPENLKERTTVCGEYAGIKFHLIRLHIAFAHELLKLVEVNKDILQHPFFKETIRILSRKARESWGVIIEAALPEKVSEKTSNLLARIRNKMVFHYDAKELFAGYKKGFFEDGRALQNACISLGNTLENARFYFADLAVQGYLEKGLDIDTNRFISELEKIMRGINIALYDICTKFIQRRGFAWQKPKINPKK